MFAGLILSMQATTVNHDQSCQFSELTGQLRRELTPWLRTAECWMIPNALAPSI